MSLSGKYYTHTYRRAILRFIGRKYHYGIVRQHKNTRILVILHLFYMSAWAEIREYLKNLSSYNYSLIVTCVNGFYNEEILSQIMKFKEDARIIKCENLGWDILPFITALHTVDLSDYDVVFKLQSKGTIRREIFLYGQYFRYRSWFLNLFEGCIGPFTVHTAIRDLLDEKQKIGLVAARNLIVEDPIHKKHMVEETVRELNLTYPENYKFVAGTCFAIRANLLNTIKKIDIDKNKFNSTGFSYAHRLERIVCFPPLWAGLKISGPNVLSLRRSLWVFYPFAWWWRKYNGVRILKEPGVNVDDEVSFICIEPRLIKCAQFVDIEVGKIKRELDPKEKKYVPLSETLPYKYLITRDPNIYEEYCNYNRNVWNNNVMSRERFDSLISSMENNGDTQDKNIVIDHENVIWDGQHRCCWLLYKKGPKHIIRALSIQLFHPRAPFVLRVFFSIKYRSFLCFNYLLSLFQIKR